MARVKTEIVKTRMIVTEKPPNEVDAGEVFWFSGYLKDVNRIRLPNKIVRLIRDGKAFKEVITGANGEWGFRLIFRKKHTICSEFPGSDKYAGCQGR